MLDKPPIEKEIEVESAERIQELEKEIESLQKTPFGEDLATIKQLELTSLEELFKQTVDSAVIQQIQQATNYQQVVAARQSFLEKHLNKEQEIKSLELVNPPKLIQPVNKERIV
jgi:transcriptional regulatory protein LevR